MRPVTPGVGQQPDRAPVQVGMHPVAVEFDFVEPSRPFRWVVDQLDELRFDPIRQRRRFGSRPSCERSWHVLRHDHPLPQIDLG
jgi:hypothetical protein